MECTLKPSQSLQCEYIDFELEKSATEIFCLICRCGSRDYGIVSGMM